MASVELKAAKRPTTPLSSGSGEREYHLGPVIGFGTFSEVRSGVRVSDGKPVAVKVVDLAEFDSEVGRMVAREVLVLRRLQGHPNVVSLLDVIGHLPDDPISERSQSITPGSGSRGALVSVRESKGRQIAKDRDAKASKSPPASKGCVTGRVTGRVTGVIRSSKLMIVQELGSGGELFRLLSLGALPEPISRFFFRQLVAGLAHCHSRGVVHRDLKPENLVLDANFDLKIIDFGFAGLSTSPGNSLEEKPLFHSGVGSLPYTAPEIVYKSELYGDAGYAGKPADVWSCAVILYVLLKGSPPFRRPLRKSLGLAPRLRRCSHFCALLKGKSMATLSPFAQRLLSKMFVLRPEDRPTMNQIKHDTWLGGRVPTGPQLRAFVNERLEGHRVGGHAVGGGHVVRPHMAAPDNDASFDKAAQMEEEIAMKMNAELKMRNVASRGDTAGDGGKEPTSPGE